MNKIKSVKTLMIVPIILGIIVIIIGTSIISEGIGAHSIESILTYGLGFICISIGLVGLGILNILDKEK